VDVPRAYDSGESPHRPAEAGAPVPASSGTGANGGSAARPATAGAAAPAVGREPAGGESAGGEVTVVPGIARYHKPDCILIRFLGAEDLQTMSLGQAEQTGCVPCRACRPEKEPATA
jgi:hypothetical protein